MTGNLYTGIPSALPEELIATIGGNDKVTIERIVSRGHATPEGQWYDQSRDEWVVVIRGAARLTFEDGTEETLLLGDYLLIPAHRRHRVSWSDPEVETIWLAVHY